MANQWQNNCEKHATAPCTGCIENTTRTQQPVRTHIFATQHCLAAKRSISQTAQRSRNPVTKQPPGTRKTVANETARETRTDVLPIRQGGLAAHDIESECLRTLPLVRPSIEMATSSRGVRRRTATADRIHPDATDGSDRCGQRLCTLLAMGRICEPPR